MTAYTIWQQASVTGTAGSSTALTLGTQFSVTWPCTLSAVWWYSPSGAEALPTSCGVWDIDVQAAIAEDAAPDWLLSDGVTTAVAGDGWMRCDMTAAGATLPIGLACAVAVFQPSATAWYETTAGYWSSGAGAAGLASGPVGAPSNAASVNGQGCYDSSGTWAFPGTSGSGAAYYADVEVTPVTAFGHSAAARLLARI